MSASKILVFGSPTPDPSGPALINSTPVPLLTDDNGVLYSWSLVQGPSGPAVIELKEYLTSIGDFSGLPVVNASLMHSGPVSNTLVRIKGASAENYDPLPGSGIGVGTQMIAGRPEWALTHAPAVATRATISRAAVATARHVCSSISATFCVAAADIATGGLLHLRDGATGAGTILRSWRLNVMDAAGGTLQVEIAGIHLTGSVNTAMTLEFAAAPGAASFQSVGLGGYTVL
jgi:hypothetical protein